MSLVRFGLKNMENVALKDLFCTHQIVSGLPSSDLDQVSLIKCLLNVVSTAFSFGGVPLNRVTAVVRS